nr:hypothetical protein [uncultured Desulfobacter sp.]
MTDREFIEKNRPQDRLFDLLKKEGIERIQQLCGDLWTDYNSHDPGITILEQLCYALTELVHKTRFDVADYLTDGHGTINYDNQALFLPRDIFPSHPLTPGDFEKILFDRFRQQVGDVRVEPDRSHDLSGIYRIRLRLNRDSEKSLKDKEEFIEQVKDFFCDNRNLCEDIQDVVILENRILKLYADIEITGNRSPAHILADIYHRCSNQVAPSMVYSDYDDLSPDGIYTGPLTTGGFINPNDLPSRTDLVNIIDVLTQVRAIDGVESVKDLYLQEEGNPEKHRNILKNLEPDSAFWLGLPGKGEPIPVRLTRNGKTYEISLDELKDRYKRLDSRHLELGRSKEESRRHDRPLSGIHRDFRNYTSIQEQFPNVYGINRFGVPESHPAHEKAKARQLKAYLLLFEQIMANFLENIQNLPVLFSLDQELKTTWFCQPIDNTHVPEVAKLYEYRLEETSAALEAITKRHDNFFDRRNRLLDYLLGLYCETFTQNSLRNFNDYYSKAELEHQLILNKINFLKHLPRLSRQRGAGFNYRKASWNMDNVSGLKLKTSILLGFQYHESRSLVFEFIRNGLEVTSDDDFMTLNKGSAEIQFVESADIKKRMKTRFKKPSLESTKEPLTEAEIQELFRTIVLFKNKCINESLLKNGLDASNYRLGSFTDDTWQVIFKPFPKSRWCYLAAYRKKTQALRSLSHLCRFLKHLNIMAEGVHLVEHLLLRPLANKQSFLGIDDDFFSLRISVVFPSYTARFRNPEFRRLSKETVRLNAPAHISTDFFWLDFQQMHAFEILYHDWLENKCSPGTDPTELDSLSLKLIKFLNKHRDSDVYASFL